jgi:flap endonuclease-1
MGIYKLMSLLQEKAPNSIRKVQLEVFTGRIIACDASMAIYQFLFSTQGFSQQNGMTELTDKDGNRTGHLVGLLNRTIQFMENGIKPIWVFDGKPPKLKNGELARRKKAKDEAKDKMEEAKETGDMEEAFKHKIRTTYVTKEMTQDAKDMLRLLGLPIIEAPCEAEAQCAALVKAGKAYATATEDMDALTFATDYLLRGFNSKKEPIAEICFEEVLKGLEVTYDQFVDLCILCGCDYTDTIDGVGPVTAYKLIKEHKTIEGVVKELERENLDPKRKRKFVIPEQFNYEDARELFKKAEVISDVSNLELKWNKPNEEELTKFLVDKKGFSEVRVQNAVKKLKAALDTKGTQSRLESFFGKPQVTKRKDPHPMDKKKDSKKPKLNEKKK